MQKYFLVLIIAVVSNFAAGQNLSEYTIKVEPASLAEFAGVQSFSWAKSGNEVLIIGGRLDGLHRRQPFASFDSAGHNNQLIVLNMKTLQVWKRSVFEFEEAVASQLKATNHCFHQQSDTMVIIGGYGIDENTKDHVTFDHILRFSVSEMIQYVKAKGTEGVQPEIFRSSDPQYAVTGGQLNYINGSYYLVGGHEFQGRYNPNDMPTFKQTYKEEMLRIQWKSTNELGIEEGHFIRSIPVKDSLLHKRDFNLVKIQHVPDTNYLVALSGVFREDADLPFQNAVQITPELELRNYPNFRQYYNQYECADFSVYEPLSKTTSVYLLGGISNFYDSLGIIAQNNDVPFVPTISRLLFSPDGKVQEYLLPTKLPLLMGAGAAFVPNDDPNWQNGFYNWLGSDAEEIELGLMIGGIVADRPSTLYFSEGEWSRAQSGFYRVYLQHTSDYQKVNSYNANPLQARFEKGKKGRFELMLDVPKDLQMTVKIWDKKNELVIEQLIELKKGKITLKKTLPKYIGEYYVLLEFKNEPRLKWEQYLVID